MDVEPVVVEDDADRAEGGDPQLDEREQPQRARRETRALATPPTWLPAPSPSMNAATITAIE